MAEKILSLRISNAAGKATSETEAEEPEGG